MLSESDAERTDVVVYVALHPSPTVFAHERHESHRSDFRLLEPLSTTCEHIKRLVLFVTEWDENTSTLGELLVIGGGDLRRSGAHEYRIVRGILAPTQRSVSKEKRNIPCADLSDRFTCLVQQLRYALDGEHLSGELRQQSGLISGAGSDLEHLLVAGELEELQIPGVDRRLGNGLSAANRKGRILVGSMANAGG